AASVHRVADAVEQVLYAPHPRPTAGLARDVYRVIGGLRGSVSRGTRARALIAPRSTARVAWAVSEWWAGARTRMAAARPALRKPSGQEG
ncbi:MAG TPA: transglutaminase, partial [Actinomycetota bacterium]